MKKKSHFNYQALIVVGFLLVLVLAGVSIRAEDEIIYNEKSIRTYHSQNGVSCILCHKVENPVWPATSESCSWCHGSPEFMAEMTKDLQPNPHNSNHFGTDLACVKCHKSHTKSINHCSSCHVSDFVVP